MRTARDVLSFGALALLLLAPATARPASLTQVPRSDWTAGVNLPSYLTMYIYVPDRLAAKPPIMVSSHSCGSSASGQMGNIPNIKAAADAQGFILILPDNPGQNCWDVGSPQSLTHDGGGDTQAVALMVKYALEKYNGDAGRVYAMGGSSGAMMTQALMAVYPDLFRAGSARAGVPAGCWADGYSSSNQWSNNCAGGTTTKTAQQWGDLVRSMYPGYTGHRPRVQTMQGEADETISYKNTAESIKEWTNVLGLSTAPTSTDTGYKAANATYDRQFWKNACGFTVFEAWSSPGGTHSMKYEEADILKFFGLDVAGGGDPEPDCGGTGGAAAGAGGRAGAAGSAGGAGGAAMTGAAGRNAGGGRAGTPGSGGSPSTGGRSGAGGSESTGGVSGSGGSATGGNGSGTSTGGAPSTGGTPATGGAPSTGGTLGSGGVSGAAGSPSPGGNTSSGGCSCGVASSAETGDAGLGMLLMLPLGIALARRRRRHAGLAAGSLRARGESNT